MVVSAPETAAWVPLSKPRKSFEHFPGSIRFEHDLRSLNRVPFRDVHEEVNMVHGEAEIAELKTEAFQVVECLDTDVDVDLFSKTVVSVVGDEHHGHPIVTGVTRNLFRATARYDFHNCIFSCRVFRGQARACRMRQNGNGLAGEKRDATFHLRVLHYVSDHAVFSVATIKKLEILKM